MPYRDTRNIEASIIDYIREKVDACNWNNIRIEKAFTEVYEGALPCICVQALDNTITTLEIGSYRHLIYPQVYIRIFAVNDGQRIDLADYLFEELEKGMDYFEYEISNGEIISKVKKGLINVRRFLDHRKELINTENLEKADRYRHLITIEVSVSKE
jgi:hypothetical protein